MSPEIKAQLNEAVLRVLDSNRTRFGLQSGAVRIHVRALGFPTVSEEEILDSIGYWEAKGHAEEVLKTANKAVRAWRITSAGIAYLDENPN